MGGGSDCGTPETSVELLGSDFLVFFLGHLHDLIDADLIISLLPIAQRENAVHAALNKLMSLLSSFQVLILSFLVYLVIFWF